MISLPSEIHSVKSRPWCSLSMEPPNSERMKTEKSPFLESERRLYATPEIFLHRLTPMVGGNHQVPAIANESELKAFIPGRPEDFTHRRRFGMLMIFGFPD